MQYAIGEEISVICTREEESFDRACRFAMQYACMRFGLTEAGHLDNVIDSQRSRDSIEIEFVSYNASGGMLGWRHQYVFKAKVISNE